MNEIIAHYINPLKKKHLKRCKYTRIEMRHLNVMFLEQESIIGYVYTYNIVHMSVSFFGYIYSHIIVYLSDIFGYIYIYIFYT